MPTVVLKVICRTRYRTDKAETIWGIKNV